jgi:transposase-like protein
VSAKAAERKAKQLATIAGQQEDLLWVLIRQVLEEVMEAEMDRVVWAGKGQGRAGRTDIAQDTTGGGW